MKNSLLKKSLTAATVVMVVTAGAMPRFNSALVPNRTSLANKTESAAGLEGIVKCTPGLPTQRTMPASLSSLSKKDIPNFKKMSTRADGDQNYDVLINEDFSLWTAGTPEEPVYIGDLDDFYINDTYWDINPEKCKMKRSGQDMPRAQLAVCVRLLFLVWAV